MEEAKMALRTKLNVFMTLIAFGFLAALTLGVL